MRIILMSFMALTICAGTALGDELMIAAVDFAPISYQNKDKKLNGFGVDIVRELSKRVKVSLTESFVPTSRLNTLAAEKANMIFPNIFRTPERENLFNWVGRVSDDHYCFMTLKTHKPVTTLDEVKALPAVGVTGGGASEKSLDRLGVTNKEVAVGNGGSLRKLFAGKIDAWYVPSIAAGHSANEEGLDPGKFDCQVKGDKLSIWIGVSKHIDEALLAALKKAYAELETEGFITATVKKYAPKFERQ